MKREEIKEICEGITKEQLDKIMDINGSDIEKAKGDLDTYKTKVDELNNLIAERDKQLKEFKDANKNNEELQAKIAQLEEANKTAKSEYDAKIAEMEKDKNTELKLRDAKAKNIKAVKALLDDSDLDEQIKKLQEDEATAFLFETTKQQEPPKGTEPRNGEPTPPANTKASLSDAIGKALNMKG